MTSIQKITWTPDPAMTPTTVSGILGHNQVSTTICEVAKLKADVKELFSAEIHFHDACGGMFFSLDQKNPGLQEYLTDYFGGKNLKVHFSDDGLQISVKR